MKIVLLALFFLSISEVGFGEEAAAALPMDSLLGFVNGLTNPEFIAKLAAFMLTLQIILRGLAEGLTKISDYTSTTWDNKIAVYASKAAWFIGVGLGKFGYGEPKAVTKEKIEQASKVATIDPPPAEKA